MSSKKTLIALRIEDNTKDKLEKLANENKCTVSDYIRQVLRENIELVDKNKMRLAEFNIEDAMLEIYRKINYKCLKKSTSESELLFYSNMFIDILLKAVTRNKLGEFGGLETRDLLDMILIQKNIELCSQYSSEENKKLYDFLECSCNKKTILDNIFTDGDSFESVFPYECKKIESKEDTCDDKILNEINILISTVKDTLKIQEKIKEIYVYNQKQIYIAEEKKLSKQFEYIRVRELRGEDVLDELNQIDLQLKQYTSNKNELEEFTKELVKKAICENYTEWMEKSKKYRMISELHKSKLSDLLLKKDYLEIEGEMDFAALLFNAELEAIF